MIWIVALVVTMKATVRMGRLSDAEAAAMLPMSLWPVAIERIDEEFGERIDVSTMIVHTSRYVCG